MLYSVSPAFTVYESGRASARAGAGRVATAGAGCGAGATLADARPGTVRSTTGAGRLDTQPARTTALTSAQVVDRTSSSLLTPLRGGAARTSRRPVSFRRSREPIVR